MSRIVKRYAVTVDGSAVTLGDGTARDRALRIPAGAYNTPCWIQTGGGIVVKVDSLPWQGVVEAGSVEVESSDPDSGSSGGSDAPSFGDDAADTLLWTDPVDYADASEAVAGGWTAGNGDWTTPEDPSDIIFLDSDVTHTADGSRSFRLEVAGGGTGGPAFSRDIDGLPTHTFVEFWIRLRNGDEPSFGKFLIIHHDLDPDNGGATGCGGNPLVRHQFGWNRESLVEGTRDYARMGSRGEETSGCDGPIVGSNNGFFQWSDNPNIESPTLASDPDIGDTSWGALNDGNWHKLTYELKTGDGLNGYVRQWIDGHLAIDSSTNAGMDYPGRPVKFKFDWVSATTKVSTFHMWIDDITIWER